MSEKTDIFSTKQNFRILKKENYSFLVVSFCGVSKEDEIKQKKVVL